MRFSGFTPDTLAFLDELGRNNDRAWFSANRERYEQSVLAIERDYVDAAGTTLRALDLRVQAIPVVDRSIFRINRDLRFTRDKSPYKTHADMAFWIGEGRKSSPAYLVRVEASGISIGCGAHMLSDIQIERYRKAVDDGTTGPQLEKLLENLSALGFEANEPERNQVPKGYSAQHPRAELLKRTQVHAIKRLAPPPAQFFEPGFVQWSVEQFAAVKPLVDWLVENLSGVYPPGMRL